MNTKISGVKWHDVCNLKLNGSETHTDAHTLSTIWGKMLTAKWVNGIWCSVYYTYNFYVNLKLFY